jgi:uncharacterized membrane protein
MKNFLIENWFKIIVIILVVWFLVILSGLTFSDSFSIDVCLKEASGLPPIVSQKCW